MPIGKAQLSPLNAPFSTPNNFSVTPGYDTASLAQCSERYAAACQKDHSMQISALMILTIICFIVAGIAWVVSRRKKIANGALDGSAVVYKAGRWAARQSRDVATEIKRRANQQ